MLSTILRLVKLCVFAAHTKWPTNDVLPLYSSSPFFNFVPSGM